MNEEKWEELIAYLSFIFLVSLFAYAFMVTGR